MVTEMPSAGKKLRDLLPKGSITILVKRTGKTRQAIHQALKKGSPTSSIVREALRLIEDAGTAKTAEALASLPTVQAAA